MSERRVSGGGRLSGEVRVPGDKSVSHRALIFGALAEGTTQIEGLSPGADVASTASVLRALGVEISGAGGSRSVRGRGLGGLSAPKTELDAGNSGTTMRLMAGVLAAHPFASRLTGDASLRRRPMERVAAPLRAMGAKIELAPGGTAPIAIAGGALRGVEWTPEAASAQVKSSILLAGLHAAGRTTVVEKIPTRDHTERLLALFGAEVEARGGAVSVSGGGRLRAARVGVPGDPSSAAFWAVAASLLPDSELAVRGVCANPRRVGFLNVLARMGADLKRVPAPDQAGEPVEDWTIRAAPLSGVAVRPDEVPGLVDEVPILALAASRARGESVFRGLGELRHKESDRLAGTAALLTAFGAKAAVSGDDLIVSGGASLRGAAFEPRDDHRLAMTAFVAGLAAEGETRVSGAECAEISYPDFYDDLLERLS
ncbi:MAG: 3-phosphoshikimate 1-carboxyvinyltransferase [Elusimicrobia bacterium]|nr:3-phosphoshikimate 1-carboxyvinyltransferase [Elusimicrobiota bacterium]